MARVLVLSNHYPPHGYGGYELACFDAVTRWRARGHDVAVLTSDHVRDGQVSPPSSDGATVWRQLPMTWIRNPPPAKWWRPVVERRAQRALARAVDAWKPDVISLWNMAGLPFALVGDAITSDIPVVAVIADTWPVRSPREDPWIRPLAKHPLLARRFTAITRVSSAMPALDRAHFAFVSESIRAICRRDAPWTFPKSTIVPLGVNLDEFPLVEPHLRPWSDRLLYVGRLDASKGVDTLVRSLATVDPATSLDVIGPLEPPHLSRLRRIANEANVARRVRFGSAPRNALVEHYRAADVLIFPSEWEEPFGIVPLEAMASGAVVIATGTGGSGEYLVDGENAVLFRAGDADALAGAISRVAADARLRRHLMEGGLRTAARLTITATADRVEELHAAAITAQPCGT